MTGYQGRVLGRLDHYATSDRRLSAAVPNRGVTTLYQRTGDALPWFCLALTVLFLALLVRDRFTVSGARVGSLPASRRSCEKGGTFGEAGAGGSKHDLSTAEKSAALLVSGGHVFTTDSSQHRAPCRWLEWRPARR